MVISSGIFFFLVEVVPKLSIYSYSCSGDTRFEPAMRLVLRYVTKAVARTATRNDPFLFGPTHAPSSLKLDGFMSMEAIGDRDHDHRCTPSLGDKAVGRRDLL